MVGVFTQTFTYTVAVQDVKSEENGEVQIYYQKHPGAVMEEKYSIVQPVAEDEIDFQIRKQVMLGNQIRIDIDGISSLKIVQLSLKWNGINIYTIKGTEIGEFVTWKNAVNVSVAKTGTQVQSNGADDAGIILNLATSRAIVLSLLLFLMKWIVLCVVCIVISIFGLDIYNKKRPLFIKIVKISFYVFIFACVISTDIKAVDTIMKIGQQSYCVNYGKEEYVDTGKKHIRTPFTVIGKKTVSLEIFVQTDENAGGIINYSISDIDGNKIFQDERDVIELATKDFHSLKLPIKENVLLQGKQYFLTIDFKNCHGFDVGMYANELLLQHNFEPSYKWVYLAFLVICNIAIIVLLVCLKKWKLNNKMFVAVSLTLGVLAILIIPPASRDDEYRHFIRAYTLASGQYKIDKTELTGEEIGNIALEPEDDGKGPFISVPEEISEIRLLDYTFNYNEGSYFAEVNQKLCMDKLVSLLKEKPEGTIDRISVLATATRGYVFYWPQVIMVWLGMLLGIRPLMLFYFARLGQLLLCTIILWIALRLIPRYKDMIWLISFVPNVLLLRISCNSDGLLISEIILYVAVIIYASDRKIDFFSKRGVIYAGGILVLVYNIVKMKPPYILLCAGILMLLNKNNLQKIVFLWAQKRKWIVVIASTVAAFCGIVMVCFRNEIINIIYNFVPQEHILYIIQNPKLIFTMFCSKWVQQLGELLQSLNGKGFIPYSIVLILSLAACKKELKVWKKAVLVFTFIALIWSIILVGFTLTPPDYGSIWGITFRYLLPALPLIALVLPVGTEKTQETVRQFYPALIVVNLTISCVGWITEMWIM